jgi:hypothetical protein
MGEEIIPTPDPESPASWPRNYYNYFTEIEDHFRRVRGSGMFLFSTLDWALIETWKNSEIPLEAVLRGVESAFEKWRSSKSRKRQINSLAYCAQAVMEEASILAGAAPPKRAAEAPFSSAELAGYLSENARMLRHAGRSSLVEIAASLEKLSAETAGFVNRLEELEQRLTALEDRLLAIARLEQTEEDLFEARRQLDSYLRPYRRKMTADQITMLERQFLDRRLFEKLGVPRLSLFYLR